MEKLKIVYKGKEIETDKGIRAADFLKIAEPDASAILVVSLNGKMLDVNAPLNEAGELIGATFDSKEGKETYWHSTSHVMAAAVKRLYPDVKVTIGP
jgi:threonyl-tRNA synthetase